jgi:hypothetical protein
MQKRKSSLTFIIVLWMLTGFQSTHAQEAGGAKEREFILKGGIFLNKIIVKDETFSAIPYKGWKPGGMLSLIVKKQHALQELSVVYNSGKLSTEGNNQQFLQQKFLNIDYIRLYKLGRNETPNFELMAGGFLDVLYAKRDYEKFVNRNNSFEFITSLGASFQLAHTFQNGVVITNRTSVPFISMMDQPSFGSEQPEGNLNGEEYSLHSFFKSSRFTSFSSFVRIKNVLTVEKNITTRQALSLVYGWDYYQIKGNIAVKQALHSLGVTYQIIL